MKGAWVSFTFLYGLALHQPMLALAGPTAPPAGQEWDKQLPCETIKPPPKPTGKVPAVPNAARKVLDFWTDKDTPEHARTTISSRGEVYVLVASDEFNEDGRTFEDGKSKMWTAIDRPDITGGGIDYISPKHATTGGGSLNLLITDEPVPEYNKSHTGANIQTWNKFCFTGGIFKTRNQWPKGGGVWPAAWMIGNLARPQYEDANPGVWPFSYNVCDDMAKKYQKINACMKNPGPGLHPNQGRGAPELDLMEANGSPPLFNPPSQSFTAASLQVAPSIPDILMPKGRIENGKWIDPKLEPNANGGPGSWYTGLTYGQGIDKGVNGFFGYTTPQNYTTNALSGVRTITTEQKDGWNVYSFEWYIDPTDGQNGYLLFLLNEKDIVVNIPASALTKKYCDPNNPADCSAPKFIPEEPQALILNIAQGCDSCWGGGVQYSTFPALYRIDYVRWYQLPDRINIGCDPPKYPTQEYIKANENLYGSVSPMHPEMSFYYYGKNFKTNMQTGGGESPDPAGGVQGKPKGNEKSGGAANDSSSATVAVDVQGALSATVIIATVSFSVLLFHGLVN